MKKKKDMLNAVTIENFRNEEGGFPTILTCSNCGGATEVFVEIIKGGPIIRLCKSCLGNYVELIDKCYRSEMSSKKIDRRKM